MLQLAGNLCAPHKAFHKLQLIVLVGLDFCNAHAGVRRRRRCDFSETPPPIHLATADKPELIDGQDHDSRMSLKLLLALIAFDHVVRSAITDTRNKHHDM